MRRRPPRSTRTDTLFPYTTLFRSFCSDGDFALAGGRFDAGDQPWARHVDLAPVWRRGHSRELGRSEEHTSELQSLMRISYAVFCLKKKTMPHVIYIR